MKARRDRGVEATAIVHRGVRKEEELLSAAFNGQPHSKLSPVAVLKPGPGAAIEQPLANSELESAAGAASYC